MKLSTFVLLFVLVRFPGAETPQDALDLVSLSQVTHQAVASGDWSEASTWAGGVLPGLDARVHVPAGVAVRFDLPQSPPLFTVRVDGRLHVRQDVATTLVLDTLVVTSTGTLELGTEEDPVTARATVRFRDNGPIDTAWDPNRLSRGMIVLGSFRSKGADRVAYRRLESDPSAGATLLELEARPLGWRDGDTVVVTGTSYLGWQWNGNGVPQTYLGTQDELRTVLAHGAQQLVVAPLNHDHAAPAPDLHGYVANLTRTIVFEGEGGALVPTQQRAHTMFWQTLDVQANDIAFVHLGRTDKSLPIDDVGTNLNGQPGAGTNPRGRYPAHFHHGGASDALGTPAVLRGCAIWGSPGWGVAVHNSHALVENCASYDVLGAHYVTEEGQELGAFRRCIAIRSEGGGPNDGRFVKDDVFLHDFAHQGHGFWFQGRNVLAEDLVSCGTTSAGFFWFHRSQVIGPSLSQENLLLPLDYLRLRSSIPYNDVPIQVARRLEAFASSRGAWVIKANGLQNHDVRSRFEDVLAWNVDSGMDLEYTRHYTLRNLRFLGNRPNDPFYTALTFGSLVRDQVVENLYAEGFGNGVSFERFFNNQLDSPDVTLIDPVFVNVGVQQYVNFNPDRQRVIGAADVVPGQFVFTPDAALTFDLPTTLAWNTGFRLSGTKLDSLGAWAFGEDGLYVGSDLRSLVEEGYYTRLDGTRFVPIVELMTDRLTGELHAFPFELNVRVNYPYLGPNLGALPPASNALPVAVDATFSVPASGRLDVPAPGLLDLATDADGDPLRVLLADVTPTKRGFVSVQTNGAFTYFGEPGARGLDAFTFRVADAEGISSSARVRLLQGAAASAPAPQRR